MFILYVSHVPVVTYGARDPGASPAAHKIEKKEQFFLGTRYNKEIL